MLPARFWAKVDQSGGADACWLWTAGKHHGYGVFWNNGSMHDAHVLAYEDKYGPVPAGLVLDHYRCDTTFCCNPDHVRPVTIAVNTLRGTGPTAENARKAVCLAGHPFDAVGASGRRRCRECEARRSREHSARKQVPV